MMKKTYLFLTILCLSLVLFSCSNDDDGPATAPLEVNVLDMPALSGSANYKAWLTVEGEIRGLGTFQDANFPKTFNVIATDLAIASEFFITIEEGNPQTPSNSRLVSAIFSGTGTSAQITSTQTLGDFRNINGTYALKTFTGDAPSSEPNGVWFTNDINENNNPQSGLNLPELSAGWIYESWVEIENRSGQTVPISLGKFRESSDGDDNDLFGGTSPEPEIPGGDLINVQAGDLINADFPIDLTGNRVFITIEPTVGDITNEPFFIEILSTPTSLGSQLNQLNNVNFFLTGSVSR